MPELNATQAAKLYGKSRMTIWRYVTSGKLSSRVGGDGQRLIDLSELIRVFGEPNRAVTPVTVTSATGDTGAVTLSDTAISELLAELRLLREEVKELRQAFLLIEQQKLRLLEHKPEPARTRAKKVESFGDLLAGLDD